MSLSSEEISLTDDFCIAFQPLFNSENCTTQGILQIQINTEECYQKKQKLEHLILFKNCSPSERSQNFPKETKLPRSQLYKDSHNIEKIMKFSHGLLSARKIFTDPNDYRSTGLFLEAQAAVMTKYRHRSCCLRVTVKWLRTSMKLYCDTIKPIHKFKNGSYPFTKT